MHRVNTILLVDDDPATNFYHSFVINDSNIAERVDVAQNGIEALRYLQCMGSFAQRDPHCKPPDLILLDINMPVMNGFDFLDAYEQLAEEKKSGVKVCILTSSEHEQDYKRAAKYTSVKGYYPKPLTEDYLMRMMEA